MLLVRYFAFLNNSLNIYYFVIFNNSDFIIFIVLRQSDGQGLVTWRQLGFW
ncbi:MAG: hypothetical protein RLZZ312_512 [Bacteroidota bacterium]|jgi:hypothetical protein